jgi:peptidoglycan hydrolase-like protein with peptidoglycan-binding domain
MPGATGHRNEFAMKRLIVLAAALAAAGRATQQPPQSPTYSGTSYKPAPQASPAVRQAQERLHTLGFYNGPIDGIAGAETNRAIERFQQSRGLDPSGTLNTATVEAMNENPRPVAAAPARAAPPALEATNVRALRNRLRQLGFYTGPVDGVWGTSTQVALERFQRSRGLEVNGQLTPATANALGVEAAPPVHQAHLAQPLDPAVVRDIQHRLGQLGFYNARADGVMGAGTKRAIEHFQESRGLAVSGDLNPTTIAALGLDPNNLAGSAAPGGGYGSSVRR